mmetsp:Transcript_18918/g.31043  ORF Transcript_18918/g.31043 Transcript_18918/m.31043 type:complete len:511 (-) Transcript_18918:193-1725(-)|eukprot:CAMPEP_0184653516 /NCGR_PEP_ID=MMETSP0308-20130426/11231_1 /TAXON_ID=38269 /ORGANISM="Gloeochaete witrockiana, Strain SAG 46.84" /LENGTH=510 /DNA_ID=CAMNT_0027089017 /DNA_START=100 /DNA_END=1632 /DNA_ORIENTATION=+
MKFGKQLQTSTYRLQYADQFLDYKALKRRIKAIDNVPCSPENEGLFLEDFENQLNKINEFFVSKEEDFVINLRFLEDEILQARLTSNPKIGQLQQQLVDFIGELVALEEFAALNFIGLRKILKKHSKKIGRHSPLNREILEQPFLSESIVPELVSHAYRCFAGIGPLRDEYSSSSENTWDGFSSLDNVMEAAKTVVCSPSRSIRELRVLQFLVDRLSGDSITALISRYTSSVSEVPQTPARFVVQLDNCISVEVWCLPRGQYVPLHDRPNTMSVSRILRGSCHVVGYDWEETLSSLRCASPSSGEDENEEEGDEAGHRMYAHRSKRARSTSEADLGAISSFSVPLSGASQRLSPRRAVRCMSEADLGAMSLSASQRGVSPRRAVRCMDVTLDENRPSLVIWPSNGGNLRWFSHMGSDEWCFLLDVVMTESGCSYDDQAMECCSSGGFKEEVMSPMVLYEACVLDGLANNTGKKVDTPDSKEIVLSQCLKDTQTLIGLRQASSTSTTNKDL